MGEEAAAFKTVARVERTVGIERKPGPAPATGQGYGVSTTSSRSHVSGAVTGLHRPGSPPGSDTS